MGSMVTKPGRPLTVPTRTNGDGESVWPSFRAMPAKNRAIRERPKMGLSADGALPPPSV